MVEEIENAVPENSHWRIVVEAVLTARNHPELARKSGRAPGLVHSLGVRDRNFLVRIAMNE